MFFGSKISDGVKALAEQIVNNPHDWVQEDYHFRNKRHPDIAIWTADGVEFIHLNGNKGFTIEERRHINNAIKISIAAKLADPNV